MACASSCASTMIPYQNCAPLLRKNTANRLIAYKCSYTFTAITDAAEWMTAEGTGNVIYSPQGVVTKSAGSPNYVQVTYNRRVVDNVENTVTFRTFDTMADLTDFDFWKKLQEDAGAWVVGYLDTADRFTQLDGADVFTALDKPEASPTATDTWNATIVYNSLSEIKPILIAGLAAEFDAL